MKRSLIHRYPSTWALIILAAVVVATVAVSLGPVMAMLGKPSPFSHVFSTLTQNQQGAPNALTMEQSVTVGDTTVRILRVVASSSQTIVELAIEDPVVAVMQEPRAFLSLRPDVDLHLSGFASGEVRQASTIEAGVKHVLLDLPPLLSFEQPARIEIDSLGRAQPANGGHYEVVPGPWQFSFIPSVPAEMQRSKWFTIDQRVETPDVVVTINAVHMSATETVVYVTYEWTDTAGLLREEIGGPKLSYAGGVLEGTLRPAEAGDSFMARFPALPEDVEQFSVSFPATWTQASGSARIVVEIPDDVVREVGERVELDQSVTAQGHTFRFVELSITEEGFALTYEPSRGPQGSHLLTGPLSQVSVTDDQGNSYRIRMIETDWTGETEGPHWSRFFFSGALSDEATHLILDIDILGRETKPTPPVTISVPH